MEQVKLNKGLKISMKISKICNEYFQATEPFKIYKTDLDRTYTILNIILNVLRFICAILEPFIPSFSAKIYEQLNLERTKEDETLIGYLRGKPSETLLTLLKPGHHINEPSPVFKQITDEQIEEWRKIYAGKN